MPKYMRTASLVLVTTDAGLTGLGESHAGRRVPELLPPLIDFFRPLLIGEDPLQINMLRHKMGFVSRRWGATGPPVVVTAGFEMALGISRERH